MWEVFALSVNFVFAPFVRTQDASERVDSGRSSRWMDAHLIRGPRPKLEQWARAVHKQSAAVAMEAQPGVQLCPTRPLAATWSESLESRSLDRCCQEEGPFSRSCTRSSRRGRRHGIARGKDVAEVFGSSEASRSGTSRWGAVDPSEKFVERARKRWAQHDEQRVVPATDLPKERQGWRNSEPTCRTFHLFRFHHTVQWKRQPS